jgi:hypothetical protein
VAIVYKLKKIQCTEPRRLNQKDALCIGLGFRFPTLEAMARCKRTGRPATEKEQQEYNAKMKKEQEKHDARMKVDREESAKMARFLDSLAGLPLDVVPPTENEKKEEAQGKQEAKAAQEKEKEEAKAAQGRRMTTENVLKAASRMSDFIPGANDRKRSFLELDADCDPETLHKAMRIFGVSSEPNAKKAEEPEKRTNIFNRSKDEKKATLKKAQAKLKRAVEKETRNFQANKNWEEGKAFIKKTTSPS